MALADLAGPEHEFRKGARQLLLEARHEHLLTLRQLHEQGIADRDS